MAAPLRSRSAPSPTGRLHLGNLRTALLCWLDARSRGGVHLLRIEDLDVQRKVPGATEQIFEDLRWLGLDWDEGPGTAGPRGPYIQSERRAFYEEKIAALLEQDLLYPCLCSRKEIAEAASAPVPGAEGPRYPGTCAHLTVQDAQSGGRPFALRFRVSREEVIFEDRLYGERREVVSETVGDFVVRRKDEVPAYQLAVVLDDIAMGVTDVVRGADLLPSTARQILLYKALGVAPPRYAHVPLLLGPTGEKFSKRERDVHVGTLRDAGRRPEEVVGFLAHSAGLLEKSEAVSAQELLPGFSLEEISKEDTWVDVGMLLGG